MIAGPAHGPASKVRSPCDGVQRAASSNDRFVDEPCRIRGVQFDDPQIGVVAALPRHPGRDRFAGRGDLPVVVLVARQGPSQRALAAAAVAVDEDDAARGRVAAMDDGGEVARRRNPAQQRADPDACREARLAQAAALRTSPASSV